MKRDLKNAFVSGLENVPQGATIFGFAGTIPYLATSLSTLYLSYVVNHSAAPATTPEGYLSPTQPSFLVDADTASALLQWMEPIQIGYGACILSFLGAIHWGLEMGKVGGEIGIRRYILGIVPPLVAWPTIFLPVNAALVSQFLAFTGAWYADTQASAHGWTPRWYSQYRLWLTLIVGGSIILTLVGKEYVGPAHIPTAQRLAAARGSGKDGQPMNLATALASGKSAIQGSGEIKTDDSPGKVTGRVDSKASEGVGSTDSSDYYVKITNYKKLEQERKKKEEEEKKKKEEEENKKNGGKDPEKAKDDDDKDDDDKDDSSDSDKDKDQGDKEKEQDKK